MRQMLLPWETDEVFEGNGERPGASIFWIRPM